MTPTVTPRPSSPQRCHAPRSRLAGLALAGRTGAWRNVLLASALAAGAVPALADPPRAGQPSRWALCPGWDQTPSDGGTGHSAASRRYEVYLSPHTHHWTSSEDHKPVVNVALSRRLPNDRFCGVSLFTNSFGQPSAYAFVGKTWPGLIPGLPNVYASVSAGILYGYVDEFEDKVPLNFGGFSPAIIPAVGVRLSPRTALEVQVLGTAALMFGASWRF